MGHPEGLPVAIPGRAGWDEAGTHAVVCVLTALLARDEVGGQVIDLSVHDVLCAKDFHYEQYHLMGMPVGGRFIGIGYPPTGTGVAATAWSTSPRTRPRTGRRSSPPSATPKSWPPALRDVMVRREIFDGLEPVIAQLLAGETR